jgi:hypothetical protein
VGRIRRRSRLKRIDRICVILTSAESRSLLAPDCQAMGHHQVSNIMASSKQLDPGLVPLPSLHGDPVVGDQGQEPVPGPHGRVMLASSLEAGGEDPVELEGLPVGLDRVPGADQEMVHSLNLAPLSLGRGLLGRGLLGGSHADGLGLARGLVRGFARGFARGFGRRGRGWGLGRCGGG